MSVPGPGAGGGEPGRPRSRHFYLDVDADPTFAVLHPPVGARRSTTGIVLLAPFGWEELCSYRSLRAWANALAAEGYPSLRIDLPGTGDSGGGPRDPGRLEAWTAAVGNAGAWLRSAQRCERIVAIGIGLGGMLALHSLAGGAAVDDLVLWAVPARGGLLLRDLRAFAEIASREISDAGQPHRPQAGDGSLEVAGFVFSPGTLSQLEALDLTALPLPDAGRRRVLVFGREKLAPDRQLHDCLARSGVALTTAEGPGWRRMLTEPRLALAPQEVFARTISWLAEQPPSALSALPPRRSTASSSGGQAVLRVGDATIRESPFEFDLRGDRFVGVLSEPAASQLPEVAICAVLLNAGAVRRIGPNRMWVEAARRWASAGVPTLRLDLVGLGDSDGDERRYHRESGLYREATVDPVLAALDALEARGLPGRFLLAGLCSGAYWALQAALVDERVRALALLNLRAFSWSEELAAARDARRARELLRSAGVWQVARIAAEDGRIGRMVRAKLSSAVRVGRRDGHSPDRSTDDILDRLRDRDVQTLLLLGGGEPLLEDFVAERRLDRLERWPNLHFDQAPVDDHIFRPVWAQQYVHDALAEVVERQRSCDHHPGAACAAPGIGSDPCASPMQPVGPTTHDDHRRGG